MQRWIVSTLLAVMLSGTAASAQSMAEVISLRASPLSVTERRVVYQIAVTNRSDKVLTGVAAVLSMHNSRPVPISEVPLLSLLHIPGGLMPGETVFLTDQLSTRNDLVAARLRDDSNIRLRVRVLTALDQGGQSLICSALERLPDWRHFMSHFGLSVPQPDVESCLRG